ncbi:Dual specificity protein phosphatase MPK-4 [Lachnellula suecica]|uniref:protein-tyrosine-phosphatase n=1 Tax=Lachnellula suecica TaxID=602035 RepID=A0A8T9BY53_9HELO|nr:Dual specificity protein phosphatase MPK-4 [Lachnellula suecica]
MSTSIPQIEFSPVEIIPGLDLSSYPKNVKLNEYTHVLNMCEAPNPREFFRPACRVLNIPLLDIDNIEPHIELIIRFIDSALQHPENRVLVHCALGINRSPSAVIAYLCHKNQIDSAAALRYLKSKKPNVNPSVLFLTQIDKYFGRYVEKEDPLAAFAERLRLRIAGLREETSRPSDGSGSRSEQGSSKNI